MSCLSVEHQNDQINHNAQMVVNAEFIQVHVQFIIYQKPSEDAVHLGTILMQDVIPVR